MTKSPTLKAARHVAHLGYVAMLSGILYGISGLALAGDGKVGLCHIPPGNPDAMHNIEVSENAVSKHMDRHGDFLNPIEDIRLGGQTGDGFIGPTCNGNGTYRSCYYVSGDSLLAGGENYLVFQRMSCAGLILIHMEFHKLIYFLAEEIWFESLSPYVNPEKRGLVSRLRIYIEGSIGSGR